LNKVAQSIVIFWKKIKRPNLYPESQLSKTNKVTLSAVSLKHFLFPHSLLRSEINTKREKTDKSVTGVKTDLE